MIPSVGDIIHAIDEMAPFSLAAAWDNCGLQVGSRGWPVRRICVALDPLPGVVDAACREKADLLVTHHPLLMRPLKLLDCDTVQGKIIARALQQNTAIVSAHTNFDASADGLNDLLAEKIGLQDLRPMEPSLQGGQDAAGGGNKAQTGFGRLGRLPEAETLKALAGKVKRALSSETIRVVGADDAYIRRVAVCTGSGGSMLPLFLASDADVYITGDMKYHEAREAEIHGKAVIDAGHFASEHIFVADMAGRLRRAAARNGWDIAVGECSVENDPFRFV